jgi:L-Ala-D/L-Glu epimerase
MTGPLKLRVQIEHWPLVKPFRITGHVFEALETLLVQIETQGVRGHGEAVGVYYKDDQVPSMARQLESVRSAIEAGVDRHAAQQLLPPGGARNALDCALWDLEAKITRTPVWQLAGIETPRALRTTFTCGADSPSAMAANARAYTQAQAIKLKLTGESCDADRVDAVRQARPDVWLAVDANQGFTPATLDKLLPTLVRANVSLVEQPFPVGKEEWLDGWRLPIPVAADESVQCLADLQLTAGRFDVVNIKLDKCGGLTEALAMTRAAQSLGLQTMVGNMLGTSLAMAPAFVVGQYCNVVDLDGPVFLATDRVRSVQYLEGFIHCSEESWGGV